jgi:hypothetical protein
MDSTERCNECGYYEGMGHRHSCPNYVEEKDLCEECGKEFKGLKCESCTDHLEDGQELIDYVVGKNECLEKAIIQNRELTEKIAVRERCYGDLQKEYTKARDRESGDLDKIEALEADNRGLVVSTNILGKQNHDLKNVVQYLVSSIEINTARTTKWSKDVEEMLTKNKEKGLL